jgi:hypothetical protein
VDDEILNESDYWMNIAPPLCAFKLENILSYIIILSQFIQLRPPPWIDMPILSLIVESYIKMEELSLYIEETGAIS